MYFKESWFSNQVIASQLKNIFRFINSQYFHSELTQYAINYRFIYCFGSLNCLNYFISHLYNSLLIYNMKEQNQNQQHADTLEAKNSQNQPEKNQEQVKQQRNQQSPIRKNIQIPPQDYSFSQLFSIRKQSINAANDLIYKKLTKSFHKIKKLRIQSNDGNILSKQYDYDNNVIRKDFRHIHDLFNISTKTSQIVKKKIDKMRNKVDKIKNQVEQSELFLIKEVEFNKIYNRSKPAAEGQNQPNGQQSSSSQNIVISNLQKEKSK